MDSILIYPYLFLSIVIYYFNDIKDRYTDIRNELDTGDLLFFCCIYKIIIGYNDAKRYCKRMFTNIYFSVICFL